MDESISNDKTMTGGATSIGATALSPGSLLGQYRIIGLIGRGGMGEVYEATHVQSGHRFAVKILLPDLSDSFDIQKRFASEALIMAKLNHPHIVRVVDSGSQDGVNFFVMDYVEGPHGSPLNLRQLLKIRHDAGKPLNEDEAIAVGLSICDALAYAHAFRDRDVEGGIVHRDLKPANVLIGPDTEMFVTDFGLARLIGPAYERTVLSHSIVAPRSVGEGRTVAADGSGSGSIGTFDYMSPEQREGRLADSRSDIYAMGAILYELLTGRKVAGVPQKPSIVRPELGARWDAVLMSRCLAYDPSERFETASEMLDAVREIASGGSQVGSEKCSMSTMARVFGLIAVVSTCLGVGAIWFVSHAQSRTAPKLEGSRGTTNAGALVERTADRVIESNQWVRLFCSSGPGIWNSNLDVGETAFATSLTNAPPDVRYLRMSLVDQDKHIIIPMKQEYLGIAKNMGGYSWIGDKRKSKGIPEFGIVNNSWGAQYRNESHVSIAGKRGWGWGSSPPGLTYPHAAFSWNGGKIKTGIVAIEVKAGALTEEEKQYLLR